MIIHKFRVFEEDDGSGLGGDGGTGDAGTGDAGTGAPAGAGESPDPGAGTPSQSNWPANWRELMSPDGKHLKTLERHDSPRSVLDSYNALRQKMDSGELKMATPFPASGKPEEQAAWRKANGIPEAPGDYTKTFKEGLVIGDADKPFVDDFLTAAHANNAPPEVVNGMLDWYYSQQEKAMQVVEERDAQYLQKSEDALRSEWGGEYRTNINMIKGLVETMPEDVRDLFMNARLGDGTVLLNHPDMARWLALTSRQLNPVHTVVPGAGSNIAGAIDDEIASIEKVMKEDRSKYNANEQMQSRLRDLYEARARARQ